MIDHLLDFTNMDYFSNLMSYLFEVEYKFFLMSNTLKVACIDNPFPHATKEIGDVCTQATPLRNIILKK